VLYLKVETYRNVDTFKYTWKNTYLKNLSQNKKNFKWEIPVVIIDMPDIHTERAG